jgi:cytochrome c biogenesis protein CcdA
LFLIVLLVSCTASIGVWSETVSSIEFSPAEWKFGVVDQDEILNSQVVAVNRGSSMLKLSLVPTCDCLQISPAGAQIVAPGGRVAFSLRYDPKGDEGKTQKFYIVKTEAPGGADEKPQYFMLSGIVRPDSGSAAAPGAAVSAVSAAGAADSAGEQRSLKLLYYYMPGCRSCERVLSVELPEVQARTGVAAAAERRDLLDDAVYEELSAFAASIGVGIREVPVLRAGNTLLQGDDEIRERLASVLLASRAGGGEEAAAEVSGERPGAAATAGLDLSLLPVMAAGLVDGINPCAFTTLVFLLASLALAGRGRREVLAIGAFFSAGVFLAYLGAGFGLFAALRAAQAVAVVAAVIRWGLAAALVVLAALSVYDYTRIRAGKPSEMLLQLPNSLKLRIHASIRERRTASALALSSFVLGVLVSIFEFACTGQVYLPTLAYLARSKGRADAIFMLLAYNLCFIAPLLAVFAASYCGVSSKRIASAFQRRMGAVKLLLAAVFAALAALTFLA